MVLRPGLIPRPRKLRDTAVDRPELPLDDLEPRVILLTRRSGRALLWRGHGNPRERVPAAFTPRERTPVPALLEPAACPIARGRFSASADRRLAVACGAAPTSRAASDGADRPAAICRISLCETVQFRSEGVGYGCRADAVPGSGGIPPPASGPPTRIACHGRTERLRDSSLSRGRFSLGAEICERVGRCGTEARALTCPRIRAARPAAPPCPGAPRPPSGSAPSDRGASGPSAPTAPVTALEVELDRALDPVGYVGRRLGGRPRSRARKRQPDPPTTAAAPCRPHPAVDPGVTGARDGTLRPRTPPDAARDPPHPVRRRTRSDRPGKVTVGPAAPASVSLSVQSSTCQSSPSSGSRVNSTPS